MKRIWLNKNGRLRAGWKIGLVLVISMILNVVVNGVASLNINNRQLFDPEGLIQLLQVPNLYFIVVVWFTVWKLEKRSLASVGLTHPLRSGKTALMGAILGATGIGAVVLVLVLTGQLTVGWGETAGSLVTFSSLVAFYSSCLLPGIGEELLFRGYINGLLTGAVGRWAGMLAGSALFALLHTGNDGIGAVALLNLFGFGLAAGLMTRYSGNLWMAVCFHLFWNFTQGFVFNGAVSGTEVKGLYRIVPDGPDWLTGGTFGVEGSVVATAVIGGLILLFGRLLAVRGSKVSICHKT